MGLDVTAVHLIWFFAFLGVVGGAVATFYDVAETTAQAQETRYRYESERLHARFAGAWFCHHAGSQTLRVSVENAGPIPFSLGNLTFLVDGVATDGFEADPVDAPGSDLWRPDERAEFRRTGHAAEPDRLSLVTERGVVHYPVKREACPILTTIALTPASASMQIGDAQTFTAAGYDQFGDPYEVSVFAWSHGGAGTLTTLSGTSARLVAGTTSGTYAVTATYLGVTGSATVVVHPGAPASVEVSPGVAGVAAGSTLAFTATAYDSYGNVNATSPISWTTDAGSITSGGVLTAQTTAQAGRSVTATTGALSDTATVDVLADAPATMTISPSTTDVTVGETLAFTATAYDQYGNVNATAPVSWTTDAGAISGTGVLTAQTTPATGRTVTATSGAASATASVTVQPGAPASVTVSPTPTSVTAGGTRAFTATVRDAYGNLNETAAVSWTTDAGSVASDGVLTAQTTAATGLTVTATSGGASGSATVDVLPDAPATVTVSPSVAGVTAGTTRLFTATVHDQYGNVNETAPVSWTTDAGSITAGGLLTAQTTAATGLHVTATSEGVSGSAAVDVWPAAPSSVTVSPGAASVTAGATQAFTATVYDAYGNVNATAAVSWTTDAGTITAGGVLTAQTTAATGLRVTATSEGVSATATVDVVAGAPASVVVSPTPTTVTAGATKAFTATVRDAYGNLNATAAVSWTTDAGTVSGAGVLTAQTTVATGRTVTATSGGVSGSATVDIVAGPVSTVTVAPSSATVHLNGTQQFTATMRDQYGNLNTSATLSWSASAGSITSGGLFTAPSASGSVTVTATADGVSGTATVTVTRATHVDSMGTYKNGAPSTAFRKGTDTVEVRVTVRDHESSLVAGVTVTVEYVNPNGVVAATRTGTTGATGLASVSYALPNSAAQGGWIARVTAIGGTGTTYDAGANLVTQTAFTVSV